MKVRHPKVALYPAPRDRNGYCGPAAIAALTGVSTGHAAKMIRHRSGQRAVYGAAIEHVVPVLRWGFSFRVTAHRRISGENYGALCDDAAIHAPFPKTLGQFLGPKFEDLRHAHRSWLVVVTHHYMAVAGDWVVDTTYREPTLAQEVAGRRRHVVTLFGLDRRSR